MTRYCTDCVYSLLIYPDDDLPFYRCGNPKYISKNLVNGAKSWPSCDDARVWSCGRLASGYVPIDPTEEGGALAAPPAPWHKRFLSWLRNPLGRHG
jgi:hypothetical protein